MSETPVPPPHDSDDGLDAGLRAAFAQDSATDSVIDRIEKRIGSAARVLLPESGSSSGPVLKPWGHGQGPRGRAFGRYQILGEIARGGIGVVLKGRDIDLGRDLAMKVLRDQHLDREDLVQRFVEEAQIAGQLQHPGIVPVYEIGIDDEQRPFFTMKLVEGKTLARLLSDRSAPEEDRSRFLRIFEQICEAVGYAHARGVVHRDLKPANILVGEFGEVQVVDWGFAKVLARGGVADEESAQRDVRDAELIATVRSGPDGMESNAGSVMGTPSYMPPEQAEGATNIVDERSDVFALGAILCEILTGKAPYHAETLVATVLLSRRGDLTAAFERLEQCQADDTLKRLARSCLAADPQNRPRDAGYLSVAIAEHLASVGRRAQEAELRAARSAARYESEHRARLMTLLLAATVLIAVVLAGAGYTWQEQRDRDHAESVRADVQQALREASLHAGSGDWELALAALKPAERLADDAAVPDTLRDNLASQHEAASAGLENARLADELERIRSAIDDETPSFDGKRYEQAFAAYGLDILDATPEAVVERVGRGDALARSVASALDDWTWRTRFGPEADSQETRKHLAAVASALDPDPHRSELRAASLEEENLERLRELAGEAPTGEFSAQSYNLLSFALRHASDHELAHQVLEQGVERYPDDFFLHLHLALSLTWSGRGRVHEIVLHASIARALRPKNEAPLALLAMSSASAGDLDAARVYLTQFGEASPKDLRGQMMRMRIHSMLGDDDAALLAADAILALEPDFLPAHAVRFQTLAARGELNGARAALSAALAGMKKRGWGRRPPSGGARPPAGGARPDPDDRHRGRGGRDGRGKRGGLGRRSGDAQPFDEAAALERYAAYRDLLDRDGDGELSRDELRILEYLERKSRRR